MPVVKNLAVLLELFPHLGSEESVHSAVAQLFSHTAKGDGNLMFDELLVINSQSQYLGRLTIQGILTCFFPPLFDGNQKAIFSGKQEKFTDLAILLEDSFQGEANVRARCRSASSWFRRSKRSKPTCIPCTPPRS
jgi:hypothetical protein